MTAQEALAEQEALAQLVAAEEEARMACVAAWNVALGAWEAYDDAEDAWEACHAATEDALDAEVNR
jgi:hypothetical protein